MLINLDQVHWRSPFPVNWRVIGKPIDDSVNCHGRICSDRASNSAKMVTV